MKLLIPVIASALFILSCNGVRDEGKSVKKDSIVVVKVNTPVNRPPIINITDTVSIKRIVICMKDSAKTPERLTIKLTEIYSRKLTAFMKKNGLKPTGAPMAWYKTQQAPFFFEAGIPVDKKPAKHAPGIFIKNIAQDSVAVAHYYGPYNQMSMGYEALTDLIKSRKKKIAGAPYEIYIDQAVDKDGKLKDPYKVQTDIVLPWR